MVSFEFLIYFHICLFLVVFMFVPFFHRFSSHLPGGSKAGRRGGSKGGGYCILDCVFHELDQTFFVLDMMAWKVSQPHEVDQAFFALDMMAWTSCSMVPSLRSTL